MLPSTTTFEDAKDFLVRRIVDEARHEGVALSAPEVEMLGFAEAYATPQQLEAAKSFEEQYDEGAYEAKVSGLIQRVFERDVEAGRKAEWDEALDGLGEEDLYLGILLERAGLLKTTSKLVLPDPRLFAGLVPSLIGLILACVVAFAPVAGRIIPSQFARLGLAFALLLAPFLLHKITSRRSR